MFSFYWFIASYKYSTKTCFRASMIINFLVNIDFHRIFPFLYLTYILYHIFFEKSNKEKTANKANLWT